MENLDHGPELAALVGIIHQQFDLVPHLSVFQNVMAGQLSRTGLFKSLLSLVHNQHDEEVQEALGNVGLSHKNRERTSRLSGGEQQRVAIARLIVQSPKALLADEHVASLDPTLAEDQIELLVDVSKRRRKTLVASVHNVALAQKYFNRVVGLRDGHIIFDIPANDLSRDILQDLYDINWNHHTRKSDFKYTHATSGQMAPHVPAAAGVPVEFHRRRME